MGLSSTNKAILAMLALVALAVAFWLLALGPKRDELKKLDARAGTLRTSLEGHEAEVAEAEDARDEFDRNYQQLVVLGKAVPGDDDTASLLVQLNRIGKRAKVEFVTFKLNTEGGVEAAPPTAAPAEGSGGTPASTVSPTEAAAATLPLGARIGPAGLAVMPYALDFKGDFFELADFIKGLDSLVKTESERVAVDGRLLTIDGFSLGPDPRLGFPQLKGSFAVTTYLTPPDQGVTGGATPGSPAPPAATPASTTTGGTP